MIHASMLAALDHNNSVNREQVCELQSILSFASMLWLWIVKLFLTPTISHISVFQDGESVGESKTSACWKGLQLHDSHDCRCSLLGVRLKTGHGHES